MTRAVAVHDADDPRIAGFRDIRERDLAGRGGHFVIEGEVVLRTAARSGRFEIDAVLLAQKRVEGLADLIEVLPADVPVYSAGQAVMDAIAGFPIHRGILALGRRAPTPSPDDLLGGLEGPAVVVALFGIGNHDNMGGVFRNAAAFGASAVLLGSDCCDPLYRKAIRVSVGAALTVPFGWLSADDDPVALLERHDFTPFALSPAGEQPLAALRRPPHAALLLGSEGPGLDAALLARAQTVSIPMAGSFDSLNVATSSGVALYHLTQAAVS